VSATELEAAFASINQDRSPAMPELRKNLGDGMEAEYDGEHVTIRNTGGHRMLVSLSPQQLADFLHWLSTIDHQIEACH
jgi:hypothetical protein